METDGTKKTEGFPKKFLCGTLIVALGNYLFVVDQKNDMAMPLVDFLTALKEKEDEARRTFLDDFRQDRDI